MSAPFDFKKEYKELYQPKTKPNIADVPEMLFIAVDGSGDPNTSPEYQRAVETLYGLSYAIKMSPKSGHAIEGFFDYVVPPLEGLWWGGDIDLETMTITDKSKFSWRMMIRQPEFVTEEVFAWAQETLAKKNLNLILPSPNCGALEKDSAFRFSTSAPMMRNQKRFGRWMHGRKNRVIELTSHSPAITMRSI